MNYICNRTLFTAVRRGAPRITNATSCACFSRVPVTIGASGLTAKHQATAATIREPGTDTPNIDVPPPPSRHTSPRLDGIKDAKPFSKFLTDKFDRQHTYLRISVVERCNLRCKYCMPDEEIDWTPNKFLLTKQEILYLSSLFVSQGVNKIRLTGGEPMTHGQIMPMLRDIGALKSKGLRELAITTNGTHLRKRKIQAMAEAGVTGINLSLDALEPDLFKDMTQRNDNGFHFVMQAIKDILQLKSAGQDWKLKINAVIIRGLNDHQILPFVEFTRDRDLELRFIEYMPFGGNKWDNEEMYTYKEMLHTIQKRYPTLERMSDHPSDSSKKWRVPGFAGRIGFITSMTENFCGSCDRLRITSDGNLKVCLHGNNEVSLRDILRDDFNQGRPIDEAAWEAMRQVEMDRMEGRTSGELGLKAVEMKLLEVIGAAVKRKHAEHAGLGVLEHMENRPMILIDQDVGPFKAMRQPLVTTHLLLARTFRKASFSQRRNYSTTSRHCRTRNYGSSNNNTMDDKINSPSSAEGTTSADQKLTHLNPSDSTVRMVTLSPSKPVTQRISTATATLVFSNGDTLRLIREASIKKGDVLAVSRIGGIMASKQTANLIPMCHNIPLSGTDVDIDLLDADTSLGRPYGALKISTTVKTTAQTGVEMDALTGVTVAGLTAYDMCKAVDKGMVMTDVRVTYKEGGKSGAWVDGKQTEKGYDETTT